MLVICKNDNVMLDILCPDELSEALLLLMSECGLKTDCPILDAENMRGYLKISRVEGEDDRAKGVGMSQFLQHVSRIGENSKKKVYILMHERMRANVQANRKATGAGRKGGNCGETRSAVGYGPGRGYLRMPADRRPASVVCSNRLSEACVNYHYCD